MNKVTKVVIIEDDRTTVDVISLALVMRWPGAKISSTNLGEEGIKLVVSENPDIVILDLGLPDTTGFDVVKGLRRFSSVPILILTVWADEDKVIEGLELGADDYMVKPFHKQELLSRVQTLTQRRASEAKEKRIMREAENTK